MQNTRTVVSILVLIAVVVGLVVLLRPKAEIQVPITADGAGEEMTFPAGSDTAGMNDTPELDQPQAGTYTAAQVATHNSAASCWAIVSGTVYDLTSWISRHPGGPEAIAGLCGTDGTQAFMGQHGGDQKPATMLSSFKIGVLAQ